MKYRILIVFLLLIIPIFTNAKDISVSSDTEKFSNFNFHLKAGEKIQGSVLVKNEGEKDLSVELSFEQEDNVKNAFSNMKFIVGEIPEKYKEELEKKENNIIELCESYDSDLELANWCNGTKRPKIELKSKKEEKIEYIVSFPDDIKEKTENVLQVYSENTKSNKEGVEETDDESYVEKSSVKMVFDPMIDRSVNLKIETLFLSRNLDTFDFVKWAKQGFKETYNANITVSNNSKNQKEDKIPFVIDLRVQPLKFANESIISKDGYIEKDISKEQDFKEVGVPRFGTVLISADIKYKDGGEEKVFSTEQARIFIFPLKELISIFGVIVLIYLFRLFWRNRKKLIRVGEKKHKKTDNSRESEGSLRENYEKNKIDDDMKEDIKNSKETFSATLSSDNIDIEWMKEEDNYDESLKKQEKKLNRSIALISFILIIVVVIFAFMSLGGESKKINLKNDEDVSIEDLITKETENEEEISQELTDNETKESVDINKKEEIKEKDVIEKIDNSEISVQVLNGGSPAGTAGKTVDYLNKKGYKINKADNAENDVKGIVVYFSGDNNNIAKQVLESVIKFREGYEGEVKSSEDLIKKYDVDVVVVLGTTNNKALDKIKINSPKTDSGKIEILDGGEASENISKISNILKKESYKITSQKKSNNTYKVTTIYFKTGDEKKADKIHRLIEKAVNRVIKEESSKIVDKYNSDIVIVVSK